MLQNVQVSPLTPTCQSSALEFDQEIIHTENSQAAGHRAHSSRLKLPLQLHRTLSVTSNVPMAAGRQNHSSPRDRHSLCNRINTALPGKGQGWQSGFTFDKQTALQTSPLWLSTLSLFWTALFVTAASRAPLLFTGPGFPPRANFLFCLSPGNSAHLAATWKGPVGHCVQKILKHFA